MILFLQIVCESYTNIIYNYTNLFPNLFRFGTDNVVGVIKICFCVL
jgi:hypothetical protein